MNKEFFLKARILFYKNGCPHCARYFQFIERINAKLPIEKRIRLVDCSLSQELGMVTPIEELFAEHFSGFPCLFIDGTKIDGMNTQIEAETYLNTYFQNEFVNQEFSDFTFDKECEFKKTWWGGNRVICK